MRTKLIMLWMLLCPLAPASAQVSVNAWLPGASIGISFPAYPAMVQVPGYPVYYAPQADANYFFYDGLYWVYQRDNWYRSSWYNGPWWLVTPETVPLYVLRVPVRYYRRAPTYFRGWRSDAPPHWGEHWGSGWERQRQGWDTWNRNSAPAPAPLPAYQRQYSGSRYPGVEQQYGVQARNYRYQPRDAVVQQHYEAQRTQAAPAASRPATTAPANPGTRPPATVAPQDQRPSTRPAVPGQDAMPGQASQAAQKGRDPVQKPAASSTPPPKDPPAERRNPQQEQPQQQRQQQQPQQPQQPRQQTPEQQQRQQPPQQQQQKQQQGAVQRDKETAGQDKDKEDKRDGERGK